MTTLKLRSRLIIASLSTMSIAAISISTLTSCSSQKESFAAENKQSEPEVSKSQETPLDTVKLSEALGHFIGRSLNSPEVKFNIDAVIKGIKDGASGKPAPMSEKEYEQGMLQIQQQAMNAVATKNLEAANTFMKENALTKSLVEIVPGKLTYIILEEGKEPAVQEHGTPQINYTGKYIDGTTFGTSEATGGPITVPLDQTIPGFSKGIVGMKEGEKRRIFVHPEMGYGTTGQLPPNSMLIFDIEVVKATSPEKDLTDAFQTTMSEELDQGTDKEQGLDFDEQETPHQELKK